MRGRAGRVGNESGTQAGGELEKVERNQGAFDGGGIGCTTEGVSYVFSLNGGGMGAGWGKRVSSACAVRREGEPGQVD
jgi:hypothetical protein